VLVQVQRQAQLGAHAVGARDQHRLLVAGGDFAQGTEAAQASHHFGTGSALGYALDALDQRFTCVDVDACVLVAEGGLLAHRIRACAEGAMIDRSGVAHGADWARLHCLQPVCGKRAILAGLPGSGHASCTRLGGARRSRKACEGLVVAPGSAV